MIGSRKNSENVFLVFWRMNITFNKKNVNQKTLVTVTLKLWLSIYIPKIYGALLGFF